MKAATLFSGGEGAGLGMTAAGFAHAWGIEYDDRIAQVARDNGFNVLTADILQCDPTDFEAVDWLHASPPCPNFSNAKTNAEETENDRALAAKVCEFITELLPRVFTLENVYQYRNSKSWQRIARTLLTHGYAFNYWHVNMADYGVPQTRKRMIVIARRDGQTPMLPPATHDEKPVNGFFENKRPWVGWYEAIEDRICELPDKEFPKWAKRVASYANGQNTFALNSNKNSEDWTDERCVINPGRPMSTITSQKSVHYVRINGIDKFIPYSVMGRLSSFPDSYDHKGVNRIIGNAIPPLFMQRLGEWLK